MTARSDYKHLVPPTGPDPEEVAHVARVLGVPDGRWHSEALGRGAAGATNGLWRVVGPGWSAVCKVVAHSDAGHARWRTSSRESDPLYWRREAEAYCTGFLDRIVGGAESGVEVPRHLACFERADGSVSVWLEDVRGLPGPQWPLIGYAAASRAFGRLQGGLVARGCVPQEPWLTRGWLRAYVDRRVDYAEVLLDEARWRDVPETARDVAARRDDFVRLWNDREQLLEVLEAVPTTLCHLDLYPDNLFGVTGTDGSGRVVAIDWAYTGTGSLGEDIGNLAIDSMLDCFVDPSQGATLAQLCVGGYLLGLGDSGWKGDERLVRLGFAASAAVKYTWMAPHVLMLAEGELTLVPGEQRDFTLDEIAIRRGAVCRQILDLADDARRLARELDLR